MEKYWENWIQPNCRCADRRQRFWFSQIYFLSSTKDMFFRCRMTPPSPASKFNIKNPKLKNFCKIIWSFNFILKNIIKTREISSAHKANPMTRMTHQGESVV